MEDQTAKPEHRRPGELAFCILLLAGSLWLFWQSYLISGLTGLTTAGVFPMLASAVMVVAAATILAKALKRPGPRDAARRFLSEVTPLRLVIVVALMVAYVFLMPWLGFIVASGLFLFAAFIILWRRGILISLALTALSLGAVYLVFRELFQVVLPQGAFLQGIF